MNMKKQYSEITPSGTHPFFYHPFISYFTPIISGKKVLDLGCGRGLNGCLLRGSRDLAGTTLIGLEINNEYIKECKKHKIYDKLIKHQLPEIPFADKSIDLILCIEVIEHMTKGDGNKLLNEIDRVCKGRVIITTPNMFFPTLEGDANDEHKSLWTVGDFRNRGYKVYGMGLKIPLLWGDPFIKIKQALYYFFTPISFIFPVISGGLIAIKDF